MNVSELVGDLKTMDVGLRWWWVKNMAEEEESMDIG